MCTWDLYGKLLSVIPGAPSVPAPLSIKGSQTVYAINANGGYTGSDTQLPGRGFVSTSGPHYVWLTPSNDAVRQESVSTEVVTLESDGEVPVNITAVEVSALHGTATVKSTTCIGAIPVAATCAITLTYDSTQLTSPNGLARDTIRIKLQSDSGEGQEFIQNCTRVVPRNSDE